LALPEHFVGCRWIDKISLKKTKLPACEPFDPAQTLLAGIGKVVNDRHVMAAAQQLQTGVSADISGSAGDKNAHEMLSVCLQGPC
jgi:hypothetical protein